MIQTELRKALRRIPLLAELPVPALNQLAEVSLIRTVRAGETVFCQGEPSPYCFGIISGEVTIVRVARDARFPDKTLGFLGPGSFFGESALFEQSARSSMATVSQPGELAAIPGVRLRAWIHRNPRAGSLLLTGLLQGSLTHLRRIDHELATLYALGRLLGSKGPFPERLQNAVDCLRVSLNAVDGILVYWRKGQAFEPFCVSPPADKIPSLPATHPLVRQIVAATAPQAHALPEHKNLLEKTHLPWGRVQAMATVPLLDREDDQNPLRGFLLLISSLEPDSFNRLTMLLLSAAAPLISEAMLRYRTTTGSEPSRS